MALDDYRRLLEVLERGGREDPWYLNKFQSRIRELRAFQDTFCPCNLHNMYDADERGRTIRNNLDEIVVLMRRANAFGAYRADGTTRETSDGGKSCEHFPPVHVDGCACDPPEAWQLSGRVKKQVAERFRVMTAQRMILRKYVEAPTVLWRPHGFGQGFASGWARQRPRPE